MSLLESILKGVNRAVELGNREVLDIIRGVKVVPVEKFSVNYLLGEIGNLGNLSLYYKAKYSLNGTGNSYSVYKEISQKNLSATDVIAMLSDKDILIPAVDRQNPDAFKWKSFIGYDLDRHQIDYVSVKRQERKDGRVLFSMTFNLDVKGMPLSSEFRIDGYRPLEAVHSSVAEQVTA